MQFVNGREQQAIVIGEARPIGSRGDSANVVVGDLDGLADADVLNFPFVLGLTQPATCKMRISRSRGGSELRRKTCEAKVIQFATRAG